MNDMLGKVTAFAIEMIEKAEGNDVEGFERLYKDLQLLCVENESGAQNHPVQWETLADFTQDLDESIALYKKALSIAEKLKEHQYSASIHYAMADRYSEMDNRKAARDHANKAKVLAAKMDDDVLKNDIEALLVFLDE